MEGSFDRRPYFICSTPKLERLIFVAKVGPSPSLANLACKSGILTGREAKLLVAC